MWFVSDLKDGEEKEHLVLGIIQKEYPQEDWYKNPEKKWVDIVNSNWKTIEVKFDRMAWVTWNFFIEVECNGKPSWINAYEEILTLAYVIDPTIYLINIEILKDFIFNNSFRKVKGWDWWRVTWVLVPIAYAIDKKLISKSFIICP